MSEAPVTVDARRYQGQFATGAAVVVGHSSGELFAVTANAIMSLSLEPMSISLCPRQADQLAKHVETLDEFSISTLREDQQALSTCFAGFW